MCANKRNGTRVVGAIRNHITAAYLRWMQIDAGCSTGPVARRTDWRTMMNCYFNVVKSKMASSPYPAAEDDRAFLTKEGFGPIFFLKTAATGFTKVYQRVVACQGSVPACGRGCSLYWR